MKVLLIGEISKYGRLKSYERAFLSLDVEVDILGRPSDLKVSFLNRAINHFRKIPIFFGAGRWNKLAIEEIKKRKPDLVVFFKPIYIKPETIKSIKRLNSRIKIFSWYTDSLFRLRNTSVSFLKSIKMYDAVFSTNCLDGEIYKKFEVKNIYCLPQAADAFIHFPVLERAQKKVDIVFVGTFEKERAKMLERLCLDGYNLKVYGNDWWKAIFCCPCLKKKGIIVGRAAYGEEMCKIMGESKIVLAFLRKSNKDTITARTFEIPSCQAFMLHERTEDAKSLFKEGEEAEYFSDYKELKEKIDFYLKHDDLRKQIAQNAYKKVTSDENYTYKTRAKKILEVYNNLRNRQ